MKSLLLASFFSLFATFLGGFRILPGFFGKAQTSQPIKEAKEALTPAKATSAVVTLPQAAFKAPIAIKKQAKQHVKMGKIDPKMKQYTYIFSGKATLEGRSYGKAQVLVRVLSARGGEILRKTVTKADGSYSLKVSLAERPNQPVDWSVQALTKDFKKVESAGRQITLRGDEATLVETPLDFQAS